jgi:hypothetical protein
MWQIAAVLNKKFGGERTQVQVVNLFRKKRYQQDKEPNPIVLAGLAGNAHDPRPTAEQIADRDQRANERWEIGTPNHLILGDPVPSQQRWRKP